MDWEKGRESDNVVEDDGRGSRFGGGGGMQFGGFHIGLGGLLVIVVVSLLFGKNPLQILSLLSGGDTGAPTVQQVPRGSEGRPSTESDEQHRFVRTILGSTEDVWTEYLQSRNLRYVRPTLKLFNGYLLRCVNGPFPGHRRGRRRRRASSPRWCRSPSA